jgi:hypothetical protein
MDCLRTECAVFLFFWGHRLGEEILSLEPGEADVKGDGSE